MAWELKTVSDRPWKQDNSGVYVLIYWRPNECDCRLDVMTVSDEPIISFAGPTEAVRKAFCDWAENESVLAVVGESEALSGVLSFEHLTYIGKELSRCHRMAETYIQD